MRKCFLLFVLLIIALICASVLEEGKDLKIQSEWTEVADRR
ncbi:hypothetical protein [Flagellimonas spongiicola]|nr:hypothetical protein [Allomuricauda spongiicola]